MNTYKIEIQEFLSRVVEIEANNIDEAILSVEQKYANEEIVLDYNDFVEVDYIDINVQSIKDEKIHLINEIIEYLWNEEKRHYEELEEPENHIYRKLCRLKDINY